MRDPVPDLLDEQVAYYRARAVEYDATSTPDGDAHAPSGIAINDALRTFWPRGRVIQLAAGTGQWTELLYADDLRWDASVIAEGPFYWGTARRRSQPLPLDASGRHPAQ